MKRLIVLSVIAFMFCISESQAADSLGDIKDLFKEGKPYADIRLRYEFVDQDGIDADAKSKTARLRLGYKTGKFYDLVGVIEGEGVFYLGNDDYNDTVNGKTDHPTVADPENVQVNQAYGQYTGIPDTTIKGGRQVITVDNHRFIGHVGWRQNNQVYDAVMITNKSIPGTTVKYGYIYNVNRIFGEQSGAGDWESQSHFYNFSNTRTPLGKITTYGYFLDFGSDSTANSNQSFGGSLSGDYEIEDDLKLKYYGEFARQSDFGDNTTDYNTYYWHLAPAIMWKGLTATIGKEVLASDDGNFAFRTPLATGHKWNGWSDKFLTTPAAGLKDFYVALAYKVKDLEGNWETLNGVLAKAAYHDFNAQDSSTDYGTEWDLFLSKPINKNVTVSAKYSNYNKDTFSADTQKFTLDVGIKF